MDEKLFILEKLVNISYDCVFIRSFLKETQEKKLNLKKKQKELEEELRNIEIKKKEIDKKRQTIKPEKKIEDLNKKIEKIINSTGEEKHTRSDSSLNKKKLEEEIEKYKSFIKNVNIFNENRNNLITKIEKIRDELISLNIAEKKYLGSDRYGNKFFYFSEELFMKIKKEDNNNNKNNNNNNEYRFEWRIIKKEQTIDQLIDNLCDKGIHENDLKSKLVYLYPKYIKQLSKRESFNISIEEIFNKNVLTYENNKSLIKNMKAIKNLPLFSTNIKNNESHIEDYNVFYEKINNIENDISEYLIYDKKEWETEINRNKIKNWLINVKDVKKYAHLLLFLNDRFKNPYKINSENDSKESKNEQKNSIIKLNNNNNQDEIITTHKSDESKQLNNTLNNQNISENNIVIMKNKEMTTNIIKKEAEKEINKSNDIIDNLKQDITNIKNNINLGKKEEDNKEKNIQSNITNMNNNNNKDEDNIIINSENENNLFDEYDNINLYYSNNKNQQSYKTRLWSKEWEPYNIEYFFIKYVNNIQSFPSLYISITIFEIVLSSLVKRRDLCKKRMDIEKKKETKDKEKKDKLKENNKIITINQNNTNNNIKEENIIIDDNSSEIEEELIKIEDEENKKEQVCLFCNRVGKLLKCQSCSNCTHLLCSKLKKRDCIWTCPQCINKFADRRVTRNAYNKDLYKTISK